MPTTTHTTAPNSLKNSMTYAHPSAPFPQKSYPTSSNTFFISLPNRRCFESSVSYQDIGEECL
ncbi:hypothetical protein AGABI1DRAFT_82047 [Agaricus bisporus var. burnettii JB137-S8]|uniref:Uncharacterized protein n=1 Tax=Agaricus bisporus var. burnettii (strain JB137-S8 / ATCC MYA-4627 / FGSC 10392) TaxID=597362 RepID=K5XLS5_AGABU|nr:uncharacterized protein AGABI1DRAFT_82047 [Agaricus bisporus var. burnettii JB137-S8]EKM84382.1 hypothetical protein AGABI1DRAFT_82047 [Agaricus bisporus var. burnettii JB137-S8]